MRWAVGLAVAVLLALPRVPSGFGLPIVVSRAI